jgi:hypothetical protein
MIQLAGGCLILEGAICRGDLHRFCPRMAHLLARHLVAWRPRESAGYRDEDLHDRSAARSGNDCRHGHANQPPWLVTTRLIGVASSAILQVSCT